MIDSFVLLIVGIFIVCFTAYDFFYTTLSFNGAGIMSKTTTGALSSFFLYLNRHTSSRAILKLSGLVHVLVSLLLWIGLLWVGLFLILSSSSTSIVHATSREPANLVNIFYFSGYTLSTLGMGDFVPAAKGWQVVVAIFSFSGFIFLTTGLSYLLNLTSAVLRKRSLSLYISNLGDSPEEIVANAYDGENFSRLTSRVSTLQEKINKHNQSHFAYPISHYFYSTTRTESLAITLTSFDEALTIIQHYVKKRGSVEDDIRPVREAIDSFLNTVQYGFMTKLEDQKGISPNIDKLRGHNISIKQSTSIDDELLGERRSLLSGFLKSSGWNWNDIYNQDT